MRNKLYLIGVVIIILITLTAAVNYDGKKSLDNGESPLATDTPAIPELQEPAVCRDGLTSYQSEEYGFSLCLPDDARVITQYADENYGILDLVIVREDDVAKLEKYEEYENSPYSAIIKSGVSAIVFERLTVNEEQDEAKLKAALPTRIPCADSALGCTADSMLDVKLLDWQKIESPNLTFRYRDEVVENGKKKWGDIGYILADGRATYQLESAVPKNPINDEALKVIAESLR